MLRNNLATRPFYNESALRTWLTVAALVVAAATVANLALWVRYSRSDTELAAQAGSDEAAARDRRTSATRLNATVDAAQIQAISADADQANALIGRRVFSWTDLFNRFESTIPANVRITSVRQRTDRQRGSVLTMSLQARGIDDVNAFLDRLEATGVFTEILAQDEAVTEMGEIEAVIETLYRPASTPAVAATQPPAQEAK